MSQHFQHDVLVIGSGAAGLTLALTLPSHLRIAVLSKGDLSQGSTFWAQGASLPSWTTPTPSIPMSKTPSSPVPDSAARMPSASPSSTAARPSSG